MPEKVAYLEDLVCTCDCKKSQVSCENRAAAAPRILPTSLFHRGCPYKLDYDRHRWSLEAPTNQ